MIFFCPKPNPWSDPYLRLRFAWEAAGRRGEPPPGPIILSGWVFSSDLDKQDRWGATFEWAERYSHSHLLPSLGEDDCYYVSCLSMSYSGKNWGEQSNPPAARPADA